MLGLSFHPCLMDLSKGMSEILVSWKQLSYLPPICPLKIAPANYGALFISFVTGLRFKGETLSKACFAAKEQTTNRKSRLHSLAAAAKSLMAVEISVALLPFSKPKVCMFYKLLSLFSISLSSTSNGMERQPHYHLAKTLCTQIPLVCFSICSSFFSSESEQ